MLTRWLNNNPHLTRTHSERSCVAEFALHLQSGFERRDGGQVFETAGGSIGANEVNLGFRQRQDDVFGEVLHAYRRSLEFGMTIQKPSQTSA